MALTADQITALQLGHAVGKYCVEIDATSPLRYCSGQDAVQVGSDWYYPRWMRGSVIDLTNPGQAKTTVELDDRDRVLETANYSDRFSGYDATIHILLREKTSATWTTASSFTWKIEYVVSHAAQTFSLHLYAAAGTKQRWGLMLGNTSIFPWAPEAGETFTFGSTTTYVTTDFGNAYAELYGTNTTAYWSLMDPFGVMAFEAGLDKPYFVSDATWADTVAGLNS